MEDEPLPCQHGSSPGSSLQPPASSLRKPPQHQGPSPDPSNPTQLGMSTGRNHPGSGLDVPSIQRWMDRHRILFSDSRVSSCLLASVPAAHPAADRARCDHGTRTEQPSRAEEPLQPLSLWEVAAARESRRSSVSFPQGSSPPLTAQHRSISILTSSHPHSRLLQCFTISPAHSRLLRSPGPSAAGRAECAASTRREQGVIPQSPAPSAPGLALVSPFPLHVQCLQGRIRAGSGPGLPEAGSDAWGHQLVPGERDKRGRLAGKPTAAMTAPCDCLRLLLMPAP